MDGRAWYGIMHRGGWFPHALQNGARGGLRRIVCFLVGCFERHGFCFLLFALFSMSPMIPLYPGGRAVCAFCDITWVQIWSQIVCV
jgi:hypothetical protein